MNARLTVRGMLLTATLVLTVLLGACHEPTGTLRTAVTTEGDTLDPDGYTLTIAEIDSSADAPLVRDTSAVQPADTAIYEALPEGTYELAASGIQVNCDLEESARRQVSVSTQDTATVSLSVLCEPALFNRIVFTSRRSEDPDEYDDNSEIFSISPDGGDLTRLTHNVEGHTIDEDRRPVVSPKGRTIAFVSRRDNNAEIYVMNPIGTEVTRLTHNDWGWNANDASPSFSPDGSTIVYHSERQVADGLGNQRDIYAVDVDGGGQRQLTSGDDWEQSPLFAPDGASIAFLTYQGGSTHDLFLMNPDGSDQRRLTDDDAGVGGHTFSPDGERIAFVSERDGNAEIYSLSVDGSDLRRLTDNESADGSPTYCPDDGPIVFASNRDGNREIYAMNADGSDQRRLTQHEADESSPVCSPSGEQVAFVSERDDNHEIYTVGTDGDRLSRVTNHSAMDQEPAWSPIR